MRVREWYGWHFPEMTKIVSDNISYAKAVSQLLRPRVQRLGLWWGCPRQWRGGPLQCCT
jgi:hypothetical protein